ncbi:MAG: prepilin-type N-terminal cleavage/methylation domain-containing protein [Lysobacterales bacterium]
MKRARIPASRRHARGFSLIEMVAAFLVFAIGIGVLMQILATSMHNARQSSDYTLAALWAQSRLDTVGVGERIEAGHSSGRFDDNYSWDLDIKQVDPSDVEPPPQARAGAGNANAAAGQNQGQGQRVSAGNAGLGGGIEVSPFDIYQVDLTVSWGGRFGAHSHTAHFGTLRAVNPDPNQGAPGGANPQPPRIGGAVQ